MDWILNIKQFRRVGESFLWDPNESWYEWNSAVVITFQSAWPVKFTKHIAAFNVIVISLLAEETEVEPCHTEAVSPGLLIIGLELFALEGSPLEEGDWEWAGGETPVARPPQAGNRIWRILKVDMWFSIREVAGPSKDSDWPAITLHYTCHLLKLVAQGPDLS